MGLRSAIIAAGRRRRRPTAFALRAVLAAALQAVRSARNDVVASLIMRETKLAETNFSPVSNQCSVNQRLP